MKTRITAYVLTLSAFAIALTAAKKDSNQTNPRDPYATAENYDKAPPLTVDALAVRSVVFDKFMIPAEWEQKARKLADTTVDRAVERLSSTGAFYAVGKEGAVKPGDPYFLVKTNMKDYRMVSTTLRVFAGAAAGTSYLTYEVKVHDGQSGNLLYAREISTENNAFAAAWSFNDRHLPTFLGNVMADYLALRARKDKGVDVLALSTDQPK